MSNLAKNLPVNWIDGMKINKNHFIAQDNAMKSAIQEIGALTVSGIKYGIVPSAQSGEPNYDVRISLDNQGLLKVNVIAIQAVTIGGVYIQLPSFGGMAANELPNTTFQFQPSEGENRYWVVLSINPFEKNPVGNPDVNETPPRLPYVVPIYKVEVVSDSQYRQYATNPYALTIGKINVNGNDIKVDEEYIPPCFSLNAHTDLLALHSELDQRLSNVELKTSLIVQKIYRKSQQNELSELVLFLCDRVMLYLAPTITQLRWITPYESPAVMLQQVVSFARVIKNTIDLRTGTGKDELMNYFSEWCELKQGEFMNMLSTISSFRYDNNDLNKDIRRIVIFINIISRLFDTLSNLEFIGKRKESGIFVKEEQPNRQDTSSQEEQAKPRRRFFG